METDINTTTPTSTPRGLVVAAVKDQLRWVRFARPETAPAVAEFREQLARAFPNDFGRPRRSRRVRAAA